jgi:hypothetical protein
MRRRPEADESEPKRKARVGNLQAKEMAPPGWGWAGPKVGFAHAPIQEQGKLAMFAFRCHAIRLIRCDRKAPPSPAGSFVAAPRYFPCIDAPSPDSRRPVVTARHRR